MSPPPSEELPNVLPPLVSLIRKSEKAQPKLTPGTWQHTRLEENLRALHLALALMNGTDDAAACSKDELEAALRAFTGMTKQSEKMQAQFAPGTSQHSLQRNRLRSFRAAAERISAELK